jgi:hypothetical protein
MKQTTSIAILGAFLAGSIAVAAGARAASRPSVKDTSDAHTAAAGWMATMAAPAVSPPAPPPPPEPAAPPRSAPPRPEDPLDWGNPYDLMLHGVPPGRTHDMR